MSKTVNQSESILKKTSSIPLLMDGDFQISEKSMHGDFFLLEGKTQIRPVIKLQPLHRLFLLLWRTLTLRGAARSAAPSESHDRRRVAGSAGNAILRIGSQTSPDTSCGRNHVV